MSETNVSAIVEPNYLESMEEVVKRLQAAGMIVERSLDRLGVVVGVIDSGKIDALSRVEGISHVEPSHEFHLPPPDVDVQ